MIQEKFYVELGKFLYAIALCDGVVQPGELKKLDKTIADELRAMKTGNEFREENEVILSKLSFYTCVREHASVKDQKRSFLNFLSKHGGRIHDHDRHVASRLISAVTSACYGISPQELQMIKATENYFREIK